MNQSLKCSNHSKIYSNFGTQAGSWSENIRTEYKDKPGRYKNINIDKMRIFINHFSFI